MVKKSSRKKASISQGVEGYKMFDENWTCYDVQYEVGKIYEMPEDQIKICEKGFHFCKKCVDCFNNKNFNPKNKIAKILALGTIIEQNDKCVTNKIQIVEEISWEQMLQLCNQGQNNIGIKNSGDENSGDENSGNWNSGDENSGNWNSGYGNSGYGNSGNRNSGNWNSGDENSGYGNSGNRNSGNRNSGNRNSGNWNSGNWNSGNWNSGNWNSDNKETGFLNTIESETIRVFNKPCSQEVWKDAIIPNFFYFNLVEYEEKEICGIQVSLPKSIPYKEAWRRSWNKAPREDRERVRKLPNWDNAVFLELTGIDVDQELAK